MSQPNIDDSPVVPEYELDQYFPESAELSAEEREKLREQHGYFRTYFREQPDRFRGLQRWLNQARFGITYDVYLAQTARYAIGGSIVGLLLGVVLAAQLTTMGVFAPVAELPVVGSALEGFIGPLAAFVVGLLGLAVVGGGPRRPATTTRDCWSTSVSATSTCCSRTASSTCTRSRTAA